LRHEEKDTKKAFKSVEKSVKPVARDTNKTRRNTTKARIVGDTVKTEKPAANLRRAMKIGMKKDC
jgi:DNA-nicking Smr family endonuclease